MAEYTRLYKKDLIRWCWIHQARINKDAKTISICWCLLDLVQIGICWYLIKLALLAFVSNWYSLAFDQMGICCHFNQLVFVQINIYRFLFKSHPLLLMSVGIWPKWYLTKVGIDICRLFLQIDNQEVGRLTSTLLSRTKWYLLKFD